MRRSATKNLLLGALLISSANILPTSALWAEFTEATESTPEETTAALVAELRKMKSQMNTLQKKLDALETKQRTPTPVAVAAPQAVSHQAISHEVHQAVAGKTSHKTSHGQKSSKPLDANLTQAIAQAVKAELAEKDKTAPDGYTNLKGTNTYFKLGGMVRMDVIHNPGVVTGDTVNTATLPIPYSIAPGNVAPADVANVQKTGNFRISGRASRITAGSLTRTSGGDLVTYAELDFLGGPINSYAYTPRLRHLWGQYGNWLVGQTWTTFLDLEASGAYTVDLGGPGTSAWVRNPQIAYTFHPIQNLKITTALELPVTDYIDNNGVARENHVLLGSNSGTGGDGAPTLPDLHMRLRYDFTKGEQKLGHVALRGFMRQLRFKSAPVGGVQRPAVSSMGFGIGLSGRYFVHGKSNVFADIHGGRGMGRYISHFANASAAYNNNPLPGVNPLEVQDAYGFLVGLEHFWTENWRTYLVYDMSRLINAPAAFFGNAYLGAGVPAAPLNKSFKEVFASLIYSPAEHKRYEVGLEYSYLQRQTVNIGQGDGHRILLGITWKIGV